MPALTAKIMKAAAHLACGFYGEVAQRARHAHDAGYDIGHHPHHQLAAWGLQAGGSAGQGS
jgi:predicted methyltransferase